MLIEALELLLTRFLFRVLKKMRNKYDSGSFVPIIEEIKEIVISCFFYLDQFSKIFPSGEHSMDS